MPLVTIDLLPGRSDETKARMAEAVTKVMMEIGGGSRDHCWVMFRETTSANWAIAGDMLDSPAFSEKVAEYKKRVQS